MIRRLIFWTVVFTLPGVPGHADPNIGADIQLGLLGTLEANPEGAGATQHDAATTFILMPWVETMAVGPLQMGAEFSLMWIKGDTRQHERRLLLMPSFRVRYKRPIVDKISFESSAGLGPSWWTSNDESKAGVAGTNNRFGWGLRFGVGAGYDLTHSVKLHGTLGYFANSSYGNELTKTVDGLTLGLGASSSY